MYQVKNKLLKIHSLFKSDKLFTPHPQFVHVNMHSSLPQWHRDHGYVSVTTPTPNP